MLALFCYGEVCRRTSLLGKNSLADLNGPGFGVLSRFWKPAKCPITI